MSEENLNEEEYLQKHLDELSSKKKPEPIQQQPINSISDDNTRIGDLKYFSFPVTEFPCGIFYPSGTTMQVRPAEVIEIQSYSMVDDTNYYDIVEKMNDMLSSCVRVKYPDGKVGSYLDIRDPDRYYLIFLIRELTFQQGSNLTTTKECSCKNELQIELKRTSFKFFKMNEKISKYFDTQDRCFRFETVNNNVFRLSPPTIGLQKSFTDYIIKENGDKKKINMSFLKIIPFVLYDRTSITNEGIKSKLTEFEKIDDISFQFLNAAVEKLSFGIEELVKNCDKCGLEVHTEMIFPNGPSAIFIVHDAFEKFIKE
jgi:hypothetical protein